MIANRRAEAALAKARPTVIVVEDEILTRMAIADRLRTAGLTVIDAATADEAAEVLRSGATEIDLVFSDVRMPGSMDGVGLAKFIRANHPQVKVALTSSHLTGLDRADHDWFFPKPYDLHEVAARIKTLLLGAEHTSGQSDY